MERCTAFLDCKSEHRHSHLLPKAICKLSAIPIVLPVALVTELEQNSKAALGNWETEVGQGSPSRDRREWAISVRWRGQGTGGSGERVRTAEDAARAETRCCWWRVHHTWQGRPRTKWSSPKYSSKLCSAALAAGPPTKVTSPSQCQALQLSDRKEDQRVVGGRGNRPRRKADRADCGLPGALSTAARSPAIRRPRETAELPQSPVSVITKAQGAAQRKGKCSFSVLRVTATQLNTNTFLTKWWCFRKLPLQVCLETKI